MIIKVTVMMQTLLWTQYLKIQKGKAPDATKVDTNATHDFV